MPREERLKWCLWSGKVNIFSLDQERKHEVKEGEKEGASEDEEVSLKVGSQ